MGRSGHVRAIAGRTAEGGAALIERAGETGMAAAEGGLALADTAAGEISGLASSAAGEISNLASGILGAAESASRRLSWRTVIGIAIGVAAVVALVSVLIRRRSSSTAPYDRNGTGRYGGLDETLDDSFPSSDAPATEMSPGV